MTTSRPVAVVLLAAVAGLGLFPFVGDEFYLEYFTHLMVMGIFAMSLDLLIGYTGLVSFGHAATRVSSASVMPLSSGSPGIFWPS
jgi:branched-chain amino acid transport system permease protein